MQKNGVGMFLIIYRFMNPPPLRACSAENTFCRKNAVII